MCFTERPKHLGFTLIELMVVIVIAAILLTIAVPSFDSMIKKNNVEALQARLSSAISTARTEAASRNTIVTICASTDGTTCVDDDDLWGRGWVIFENDGHNIIDVANKIAIDVFESEGAYSIESFNNSYVSFNSQGFLFGGNVVTFDICEPGKDNQYARGVIVNKSGLIVKSQDTDNDGTHNNMNTKANIDCTTP